MCFIQVNKAKNFESKAAGSKSAGRTIKKVRTWVKPPSPFLFYRDESSSVAFPSQEAIFLSGQGYQEIARRRPTGRRTSNFEDRRGDG